MCDDFWDDWHEHDDIFYDSDNNVEDVETDDYECDYE